MFSRFKKDAPAAPTAAKPATPAAAAAAPAPKPATVSAARPVSPMPGRLPAEAVAADKEAKRKQRLMELYFRDGGDLTDVDVLVCPLHQYAYRWADGASTSGAAPIRLFPVHEQDGDLVLTV